MLTFVLINVVLQFAASFANVALLIEHTVAFRINTEVKAVCAKTA